MCPVRTAVPVHAVAMTFPPDPVWVRNAREAVRTAMNTVVPAKQDLIDTAMLLTSEAVTNAVLAASHSLTPAPIGFRAGWTADGAIHVLVQDMGPGEPVRPPGTPPDPLCGGAAIPPEGTVPPEGSVPSEDAGSPEAVVPPEEAEQGRGLLLITSEASDWGVCRHGADEGKSVWFRLG